MAKLHSVRDVRSVCCGLRIFDDASLIVWGGMVFRHRGVLWRRANRRLIRRCARRGRCTDDLADATLQINASIAVCCIMELQSHCVAPYGHSVDVKKRIERTGASNDELARRVMEYVAKGPGYEHRVSARSLGAKIGELARGTETWWRSPKQANYLDALARELECDRDDLVAPIEARRPQPVIVEFPELAVEALAPLAPLYGEQALSDIVAAQLGTGGFSWLVVPDGGGKSLALEFLRRVRIDVVTMSAHTLYEVSERIDANRRTAIDLDRPDARTDNLLVRRLREAKSVCVLAPFPPPTALVGIVRAFALQLQSDWRQRLFSWLNAQHPENKRLDAKEWEIFLEHFDPDLVRVVTPADLLSLLGCAFSLGIPTSKTKYGELARRAVAARVQQSGPGAPWLSRHGAAAFEALVRQRFESVAWRSSLPDDAWATLLRPEHCPAPDGKQLRALSERVKLGAKSARDAKTIGDEIAELASRADSMTAIASLRASGLFARTADGSLEPSPTWVRDALEGERADLLVAEGSIEQLGRVCADVSRRPLMDAALLRLPPPKLVQLIVRALAEVEATLGVVATIEALFEAAGHRMHEGWTPTNEQLPTLRALGLRQWQLLRALPSLPATQQHLPLTRRSVREGDGRSAEWLAAAWRFTLTVPLVEPATVEFDWRFAGWKRPLTFADLAEHLPFPYLAVYAPSPNGHASVIPGFDARPLSREERRLHLPLAELGRELLERVTDSSIGDNIPLGLFAPALLVARTKGWRFARQHLESLFDSRVLDVLFAWVPEEDDEWTGLAPWFWSMWRDEMPNEKRTLDYLLKLDMRLVRVLVRNLSSASLVDGCPVFPPPRLVDLLHDLGRAEVVRDIAHRSLRAIINAAFPRPSTEELSKMIALVGDEDLDVLVECATDAYWFGVQAAARVWELDADRALQALQLALTHAEATRAYAWLVSAPKLQWERVLDAIDAAPSAAGAVRWLSDSLSQAEGLAPRMFEAWLRLKE